MNFWNHQPKSASGVVRAQRRSMPHHYCAALRHHHLGAGVARAFLPETHAIARVRSLLWAPTLRGSTKESPPPGNEKLSPPHKRAIVRSLARQRAYVKTVLVIRRCTLRTRLLYTQTRPSARHIVGLSSLRTFACALAVALLWLLCVLLWERNSRGDG